MHVNAKIGLTFASALRAFLRQDPDVVMVGEIRDKETAEIAINASLTGHLVLSTIHTNDAAGAVTRLVDMGVEPFLLRSSRHRHPRAAPRAHALPALQGGRTRPRTYELEELGLTPERCAARAQAQDHPELALLPAQRRPRADRARGTSTDRHVTFYRPKGCDKCARRASCGRRGIYELL